MFKANHNPDVEANLNSLMMTVYIKVNNLANFLASFDTKRFFSEGDQKRLPEYQQESWEYQTFCAIRERFISCTDVWERINIYNNLIKQIRKMEQLNYSAKEKNTLKEMYDWITESKIRINKFNEENKEYFKKRNLHLFEL